jgi:copper chaperone CopZ
MALKRILIFAIVSLGLGFSTAHAKATEANVKVSGMVCGFCASKLEKTFKEQDSVEEVHIDLDKKNIHLIFKDSKNISDDQIKKIITDAGFKVVDLAR